MARGKKFRSSGRPKRPSEPAEPAENAVASPEEIAVPEQVHEESLNPSRRWTCPGCAKVWEGEPGSDEWKAWKSHLQRHAHAHPGKAPRFGMQAFQR